MVDVRRVSGKSYMIKWSICVQTLPERSLR